MSSPLTRGRRQLPPVARFLLLLPLLLGAVACGVPLSPVELTATAVNGGNLAPSPTPETHILASSILAPIAPDAPAAPTRAPRTPAPAGTPPARTPTTATPPPGTTPTAR